MRLPGPIDVRRGPSIRPVVPIVMLAVAVVGGVVLIASRGGGGDDHGDDATAAGGDAAGSSTVDEFGLLATPARLLDTGPNSATIDGELQAVGPVMPGTPLEVPVAGRGGASDAPGLVVLTATATGDAAASSVSISPCGSPAEPVPSLRVGAAATVTRNLVVPVGGNGSICVQASAPVDLTLDLTGTVDPAIVRPFPSPVRLVDTRASGATDDGRFSQIGVRPESATTRVPIAARFNGLGDVGALLVSVAAADPLEPGELTVFAPETVSPSPALFGYEVGTTSRSVEIVPIGASGELCVSTTGRTDLTVEILALVPASNDYPVLPSSGDAECPGQDLFPNRRIVALYGTQRSARLGVLGEQTPAEAVERLEEIAEPWRAGEIPVLPAFELIATLATATAEDRGVYNIQSSPEFVQEYLDVARRNGFYLILDLQAGQSDFLTEAKYYEEFLRQPDVGLALDPEWRTPAPSRPKGGQIGTVDAPEVNAVVAYLAELVEEEDLPEKLLVLHQFTDDMITNRDQIEELPGVAIMLHMDGFGPRPEKLNSYDVVRADPPWDMGLKLFFDEDTDIFEATDVLGGIFEPAPLLVTYQ